MTRGQDTGHGSGVGLQVASSCGVNVHLVTPSVLLLLRGLGVR